jgi:predicted NAD/FAD-binding protein
MKIAVVGSGISGLACAYYLSRRAEVHVFEANLMIGGHTNTLDVNTASGSYAVDTGFIVFNDRTYPRFIRLMNELNVLSQPSSMSFSVKVESTGLEYNGTSLNTLFAQRSNFFRPSFYRMIRDILRFNREAPRLLENNTVSSDLSLEDYLNENGYSRPFMDHYIIPMGAAIWSAGVAQMRRFPIGYFVRFFKNHGMLSVNDRPQWRVIQKGSRSYLPGLTAPFKERIHTNTPVKNVRRDADGVTITTQYGETRFDQVVLAGHADQTLAMLSDATTTEREILSAFPYQENKTVLHTDTSVLPKRRAAWASWNYLVPNQERSTVAVTYDMNILQTIQAPEEFLVSLNMDDKINPAKILKKMTYHHPVYSAGAVAAQQRWSEISGIGRTHYCGAYWGYGFHEDGVASAHRVCESLGVRP